VRILTFTTLYPNAAQPNHGLFVEHRLRNLIADEGIAAKVIAPVPWFPVSHPSFGRYARFARAPHTETRHGIDIVHPRYPLVPKIGMHSAPYLLAMATYRVLQNLRSSFDFDLIDAHFFYPDGVAAVMLGAQLGKPVVVTARGTDINLYPRYPLIRRMIQRAAQHCAAMVTVCEALRTELIELGADPTKVVTLRNGVDLELFHPVDRQHARAALGMTRRTLLSVGHLIDRKGHDIVIQAMSMMPDSDLVIVGSGEKDGALRRLVSELGLGERVRFAGAVDQVTLRDYYGAADALVLASSREGWANVLLEAMACGTPVIASRIWGTPEVVRGPESGVLMRSRSPEGLVDACASLFGRLPSRELTRRYAEQFSWRDTSRGQVEVFESARARRIAA